MPAAARRLSPVLAMLLLHAAAPARAQVTEPWSACGDAAAGGERAAALPAGLLAAVGRVESGRTDHAGRRVPWPHAVNVEGAGRWFETADEAAAHVRSALAGGARSIDVGCFQINLQHHPTAFATLGEAFDPAANAAYAAGLLARHFTASGSWGAAVGRYHSMTPRLGDDYAARVMAEWQGRASLASPSLSGGRIVPVVWRPGIAGLDTRFGVRVFAPSGTAR